MQYSIVHNNLEWVCDLLTRVALSMLTDGPGLFDKPARVVGEHTTNDSEKQ